MKVVCIGSGNVATHMAAAFKAKGHELVQVWSRTDEHGRELADSVGAKSIANFKEIDPDADLYLIAVKDDAIPSVVSELSGLSGLVVHTSGATAIDELSSLTKYGVLYPLQTFSKHKAIDFSGVPLCIEARDFACLEELHAIADELSELVYEVNSEQRKILHLAAVFACNFVNHLYDMAAQVLQPQDLNFELLRPLIMETALKVQHDLPANVQTGPAIRGDEQTMKKHLQLLDQFPHMQHIYQTLSNSIKKSN